MNQIYSIFLRGCGAGIVPLSSRTSAHFGVVIDTCGIFRLNLE